uniref:Uncharacterized protein n=1 Tax=Arundo donax TaxID=35708 RepID=A0A0A8YJB5_ARUDO
MAHRCAAAFRPSTMAVAHLALLQLRASPRVQWTVCVSSRFSDSCSQVF